MNMMKGVDYEPRQYRVALVGGPHCGKSVFVESGQRRVDMCFNMRWHRYLVDGYKAWYRGVVS